MRVCVLSPARWDAFQLSKQNVTRALAALGHDLLYVDPPLSPLSVIRHRDRLREFRHAADRQPLPRVRVWTPRVVPGQNARAGQAVNARLLERGVRTRLGQPDLSVAFALEARGALQRLRGRRVYYAVDSLEDVPGADVARFRAFEREMLRTADVVVGCSKPLVEQLQERAGAAVYIPHGVDVGAPLAPGEAVEPPELAGRPRPFVGYVGSINFRIDADLLAAARRAAGGTLVLVGSWWSSSGPRLQESTRALLDRPDVVTVPHRDLLELRHYFAALDVGLAPYAETPFNRKSFPIKIPQYLAFGTPVVSTENGATDEYPDLVYTARGPEEFEGAVRAAVAEQSAERQQLRRDRMAARPWTVVAEELLAAAGPFDG